MNTNSSPIVAKIIFKDGNTRFFYGNRYEKENCNVMVYKLRTMLLKMYKVSNVIQVYDNRIIDGDRIIFDYQDGVVLKNDLASYLGDNYNAKL